MKKIATLFFTLCAVPVFLFAQNTISSSALTIKAGQSDTLRITLNNTDLVAGLQFDITLPAALMPSVARAVLSTRATDHSLVASALPVANSYRFMVYSLTNAALKGTSGTVISVPVTASAFASGVYVAAFSALTMGNASGSTVAVAAVSGSVTFNSSATSPSSFLKPNYLFYSPLFIKPGEVKSLDMKLDNKEPIVSLQIELSLPVGLSINTASIIKTARLANHTVTLTALAGNKYRIDVTSASSSAIGGNSGSLFSLSFSAAASMVGVEMLITPTITLLNASGVNVSTQTNILNLLMLGCHC